MRAHPRPAATRSLLLVTPADRYSRILSIVDLFGELVMFVSLDQRLIGY